jgi:predicted NAD-dependent protein-ADP-ribosyltransferase YbiA (DUF1768 family)
MDRSSEFIRGKARFGSYPTQKYVEEFENMGVRYFVNLTYDEEKHIIPYKTKYTYIHYPISDHRVPTCWKSFAQFIIKIGNIIKSLKEEEQIYIHCKGGHGRSGIVVASLLCYLYNIPASEGIAKTNRYHSYRKDMREKWRKIGSPQTRSQKHFVSKFFETLYIYDNNTKYFSCIFRNDAEISVNIPNLGKFSTTEEAFKKIKKIYFGNKDFCQDKIKFRQVIQNMLKDIYCNEEKLNIDIDNWDNIKYFVMYILLRYKFKHNDDIREKLLKTGLRPIIYWGDKNNFLGEILSKIRNDLYIFNN